MNDNLAIESRPVDYVNDPRIIAQNDDVISINATIQIDLTGACATLGDERQVRVQLTEAGRALGGKAARIPHCILEASGLSVEDLDRLRCQITALHNALESYADAKPTP